MLRKVGFFFFMLNYNFALLFSPFYEFGHSILKSDSFSLSIIYLNLNLKVYDVICIKCCNI